MNSDSVTKYDSATDCDSATSCDSAMNSIHDINHCQSKLALGSATSYWVLTCPAYLNYNISAIALLITYLLASGRLL